MKRIALISCAAMAALMSCQKEGLIEKTQSNEPLVFTASIASDQTKTTLNFDDSKMAKIYWESTDQITIKDASGNVAVYELTEGADTSSGTFNYKSGATLASPSTYTATYGTKPLADQVYSASGSVPLYMTAPSTSSTDGLKFTAQYGVLRVTLTDNSRNIMRVEVSGETGTYKVTAASGVSVSSATDFYIVLPAGTYTSLNIYDDNFWMASQTGISLEVKSGLVKPAASSSLNFSPCSNKGFYGVHAVVQLWEGGPFWAETNIGATTETEYGQYFAWGYPDGCVRNSDNTGWVLANDRETVKTFDNNSQTGFPDYMTHSYYDMAAKSRGDAWSVPRKWHFINLFTNCEVELVKTNTAHWGKYQVNGLLLTGKDDYKSNSIFLPSAGCSFANPGEEGDTGGSKLFGDNNYGRYWTVDVSNMYRAQYLKFAVDNEPEVDDFTKYAGFSVRPIYTGGE